jgi:hypothetical protein
MTRKGWHPLEFRQMAAEHMKRCENIVALSDASRNDALPSLRRSEVPQLERHEI